MQKRSIHFLFLSFFHVNIFWIFSTWMTMKSEIIHINRYDIMFPVYWEIEIKSESCVIIWGDLLLCNYFANSVFCSILVCKMRTVHVSKATFITNSSVTFQGTFKSVNTVWKRLMLMLKSVMHEWCTVVPLLVVLLSIQHWDDNECWLSFLYLDQRDLFPFCSMTPFCKLYTS